MYDDDLFNMLNSYTATDTDTETEKQTFEDTTSPQQQYNPYQSTQSPYIDDYSTAQNYEEETSYNSNIGGVEFEEPQTRVVREMHTPTIKQQAPAVNLIKKREKVYLSSRLKMAMAVCIVIFAAIVFATVWNFAQAGAMQASFAGKQAEINQISQSINELKVEYNELSKPDANGNAGYVEKVDGVNSFTVSLDNFYSEPEIEKLPSNWFNDVCEFFSKLFA